MNQHLQNILNAIQEDKNLSEEEKNSFTRSLTDADKEFDILRFKLDRTEKVNRTTAILLGETIEELENKRKDVEAQKRELEIEASLESVRTTAMAMNKREDMLDVCLVISQQLQALGVKEIRNVQTAIIYESKKTYLNFEYYAKHDKSVITEVDYQSHPLQEAFCNQMLKGPKEFFSHSLTGAELKEWYAHQQTTNQFADSFLATATSLNYYWYSLGPVALGLSTYEPLSEQEIKLFIRFSNVFELSYRRFLDIEKAAAQAREAQMETALERVRSRSLAMHKSDELKEVIRLVLEQFIQLKINVEHAGFYIDYKVHDDMHIWLADPNIEPFFVILPYFDSVTWNSFRDAKATGKDFFTNHLDFKEKNRFYKSLFKLFAIPEEAKNFYLQCEGLAVSTVLLDDVGLYIENFSGIPYSDEDNKTLMRFGKVFQQTYTRFLDLKKAEEQTKESQIQLALERVRARTMAMQRSDELSGTAALLFQEFKKLTGQDLIQTTIGIYNEAESQIEFRATDWEGHGTEVSRPAYGSMQEPTLLQPAISAWKSGAKSLVVELTGKQLEDWVHYRNEMTGVNTSVTGFGDKRFVSMAFFSKGHLSLSSSVSLSDESIKTLERFAAAFDNTYTRFLDLEKAEAQAREAQVETALEKVRSRTLAMQHSDELAETSSELFRQMIGLGIEPNRLYITIIHKEKNEANFWITDEDGSKLNAAYTVNFNDNSTLNKMYEGWKQQLKNLTIDMRGEELQGYFNYLKSINVPFKGGLGQYRRVQHLAYFSKGFIGLASPDEQPPETLNILERFAYVFNLTFTRFNDLQVAEANALKSEQDLIEIKEARQKAEAALAELQATQKQLVQSEKMASLGELTAGIAHEIQNPLNFVNNFSEVSNELIEELKAEKAKPISERDNQLEDDILRDLSGNLEKINHHGKRADAIVKGMLQHSRSSSGTKEPTDINALCDEYLRLAYHGLRAKDKSFNAKFETDFDNSIGKINVMPQELGRVILNLINNAFYAVSEKKKLATGNYEPTIIITTKKEGNKAEIKVTDNGTGIPDSIKEKILQPFFTTKPTGQGTGLGLSLSYDIVTKAHGGDLKIETKEGEGTSFIILIPSV